MTSVSDAVAAPLIVDINGRRLKISPLRDIEWGELERWAQDRYLANHLRLVQQAGLDADEIARERKVGIREARAITTTSLTFLEMLNSVEGALRYAWASLWRERDGLTEEDAMLLLSDPNVLARVTDKVNQLNTLVKKKPTAKARTERKRKSR